MEIELRSGDGWNNVLALVPLDLLRGTSVVEHTHARRHMHTHTACQNIEVYTSVVYIASQMNIS